jgi:hypothetical protein
VPLLGSRRKLVVSLPSDARRRRTSSVRRLTKTTSRTARALLAGVVDRPNVGADSPASSGTPRFPLPRDSLVCRAGAANQKPRSYRPRISQMTRMNGNLIPIRAIGVIRGSEQATGKIALRTQRTRKHTSPANVRSELRGLVCVSKTPVASASSAFASATYNAAPCPNVLILTDLENRGATNVTLLTLLTQNCGALYRGARYRFFSVAGNSNGSTSGTTRTSVVNLNG